MPSPVSAEQWYQERFGSARVWLLAPGPNAQHWDEFREKGIIAIGWDELGDLREFDDKQDIHERIPEIFSDWASKNPKNDSLACHQFVRELQSGDYVVIKQGIKVLLGYGVIESDYSYDHSRPGMRHVRRVRWEQTGRWQLPKERRVVPKTLTHYSDHKHWLLFAFRLMDAGPESVPPPPGAP